MTKPRHLVLAASALAALAQPAAAQTAAAAPTFEGKTIRFVINFGVGGPLDGFLRAFTPYIEQHLPGRPTIVVENRPGAAGRVGASYLFNIAKPDGLTIGGMVGVPNDALFGLETKYDPAKFTWLGATPQTQVTLARTDLGVKTPADLRKPARPLVMAGTGANSNNHIASTLALGMMGVVFKSVHGYTGQAATVHALRQGEANMTDAGAPFYLPNRESWAKEGLFLPVLQRGDLGSDGAFRRSPLIPDLPTMPEAIEAMNPDALKSVEFAAYRLIAGTYALQYALIAPPGVPDDVARALRAGVAAAFNDPRAVEDLRRKMSIDYNFLDGDEAKKVYETLAQEARANPAARDLVAKMIEIK